MFMAQSYLIILYKWDVLTSSLIVKKKSISIGGQILINSKISLEFDCYFISIPSIRKNLFYNFIK